MTNGHAAVNSIGNTGFILQKLLSTVMRSLPIELQQMKLTSSVGTSNSRLISISPEGEKEPNAGHKPANTYRDHHKGLTSQPAGLIKSSLRGEAHSHRLLAPSIYLPHNLMRTIIKSNQEVTQRLNHSPQIKNNTNRVVETDAAVIKTALRSTISNSKTERPVKSKPSSSTSKNNIPELTQMKREFFSALLISPRPSNINRSKALRNISHQIFQRLVASNVNSSTNLLKSIKTSASSIQTHDLKGVAKQESEAIHFSIAIPMPDKTHKNIQLEFRAETKNINDKGKNAWVANITFEDCNNGKIKSKVSLTGDKTVSTNFHSERISTAEKIRSKIDLLRIRLLENGFDIGQLLSFSEAPVMEDHKNHSSNPHLNEIA